MTNRRLNIIWRKASVGLFLLFIFLISAQSSFAQKRLPKHRSVEDSLIKVWGKLQRQSYFSGKYEESVYYFDSLLEQQGVRINYVSYRIGLFCAKKANLKRDLDFGEKVFGKQIMSEKWRLVVNVNEKLYTRCSHPPEPNGGIKRFERYLKKNLEYPKEAIERQVEGSVEVQFVINKDGTIGGACVHKGLTRECNREAERLIRNSPRWHGAKHGEKPVYFRKTINIDFKLPK
ncbi:energy transducer TonB [Reichenbachiella versicolor]|uniref:energy transducer TonB n=1 Tax=Reichenbachiella versicolor TaxID=1821036 RepID=UPI000D6E7709|nr:energy transducer TonB [Reichenbachiella versicolor]